ncbi:hypothetical protein TNCV_1508991 [Trichonephila clavipes]|nr:hypothetical protein TNCV_1508991 [Trichonephila clavipes]
MVSVQHLLTSVDSAPRSSLGNLGRWPDRVTYYEPDYPYTILFEPNFGVHIPRLGGVSTSHDGCVQCGFDRLPPSRRRVREMVDVVGRLGNASRRSCALAHRGSPTLKRALEQHVQRSHEKALAHGMPLSRHAPRPYIKRAKIIAARNHSAIEATCQSMLSQPRLFCACQRVSSRGQANPAHRIVHCHDSQGMAAIPSGQPVPVELSIASIPEDGTEPEIMCITVNHCQPTVQIDKDVRFNCQENGSA